MCVCSEYILYWYRRHQTLIDVTLMKINLTECQLFIIQSDSSPSSPSNTTIHHQPHKVHPRYCQAQRQAMLQVQPWPSNLVWPSWPWYHPVSKFIVTTQVSKKSYGLWWARNFDIGMGLSLRGESDIVSLYISEPNSFRPCLVNLLWLSY